MKRFVFLAALLSAVGLGAQKDRNWQTGRVLSSDTKTEYIEHGEGDGHIVTALILRGETSRTETRTLISGPEYTYLIIDHSKHPCRFIVGDDVRYVQEKGKLDVLDADAKGCKLDIFRQERVAQSHNFPLHATSRDSVKTCHAIRL